MTAAAVLPPPARPPHDPLWMILGGVGGWPSGSGAKDVEVETGGCALRLAPAPGATRLLSEENGSLGGLRPPSNVTLDCEGFIWLLGKTSALLRRFDPCTCLFVTVPCTGGREPDQCEIDQKTCGKLAIPFTAGAGFNPRAIVTPAGISAVDATLFVCDAGSPNIEGRLLVFDRRSFALRSVWRPPAGATSKPWSPRDVVVDGGIVYVADPANGAIHRFARWGGWLGTWDGLGAVTGVALDCTRRVYAVVSGADKIVRLDRSGKILGQVATPAEVLADFPVQPFQIADDGAVDLSSICGRDAAFDQNGEPAAFPAAPDPAFATSGTWTSPPLDSRIANCVWHRIELDAEIGRHQRIAFASYTAEVELSATDVELLPSSAWVEIPQASAGQDALILSPAGRYLWLRVSLQTDGRSSPRLCSVTLEYPRISLRRYLPATFGADPVSADFTDRLLAIFDCGFRDLEARVDNEGMLFDANSAPSRSDCDILAWLGAWLGVSLERSWPEGARRSALKAASRSLACRGTVRGLREILLGWLGWTDLPILPRRPDCAPRCGPAARPPDKPLLVLEHWKLRRWLWLGKGKLGSDAVLWGEKLLGRSQLNNTARLGVTRLDTTRNPLTDPFAISSNRFSVFLPARHVEDRMLRSQVRRLIDDQKPADALANLVGVHARMRIGIQASIGFDSVVGCWPSGITIDEAQLGRGTVLSGTNPGGVAPRIGRTARLQPAHSRAAA